MTIDKNYIKDFNTLNVIFCNGEEFKIPIVEIIDIRCEATDDKLKKTDCFRIWDGIIKITPQGGFVLDENYNEENETYDEIPEEFYYLKNHISLHTNLNAIILENKNKEKVEFNLPYDPLVESIYEKEIELSNCPSAEIDENGYITIGIGKSSKMQKRVDNNYHELIKGWTDLFKDYKPDSLKVKIYHIANFKTKDNKHELYFSLELLNKKVKHQSLRLTFNDCSNCVVNMNFYYQDNIEMNISKMINGNIFVDFTGLGLTFECRSIIGDDDF